MTRDGHRARVFVVESAAKAALPIIRSAAAMGRSVVAGAATRVCAGMFSRFVRERLVYPDPTQDPDGFTEALLRSVRERDVEMLYPVGDVASDLIARHQDAFRKVTRLVLPPYRSFVRGRDKIMTLQAAAAAGVPIPSTWYPDERSLDEVVRRASYPCLVKPAISAGARGITKAETPEALRSAFPSVEAKYGRSFVQDWVPPGGAQFKADAIMGREGSLLAAVVYEKLRFYPPAAGSSVLNRTVRRPDIVEQVRAMMVALEWSGFCDFDFISDPRDGQVKLMEINPRFPESYGATYAAGLDMTEMLWEMAHGREPEPITEYLTDQYLRFFGGDLLWFVTSRDRWRQLGSWLTFVSPRLRYQVFSIRDPGPALGYLLENLQAALSPQRRAARFRLSEARERSQ
ncbi:MAG TPA: ATP-grasp domain-containing protein [Thermoanaerobaculia bacterium]|nr:ATP-grasp domain-containing protein [Thermoanaerobaculia bacterium]HQP86698.1 ATP-grasp domain-containing protein [Thermoanaerobaculia bacterium]